MVGVEDELLGDVHSLEYHVHSRSVRSAYTDLISYESHDWKSHALTAPVVLPVPVVMHTNHCVDYPRK